MGLNERSEEIERVKDVCARARERERDLHLQQNFTGIVPTSYKILLKHEIR